jgi:hypothetical protein
MANSFEMYAGDSKTLQVVVLDEAGAPADITGSTIRWQMAAHAGSPALVTKSTDAAPAIVPTFWSTTDKGSSILLTDNNLTVTHTQATWFEIVRATASVLTGTKKFWSVKAPPFTVLPTESTGIAMATADHPLSQSWTQDPSSGAFIEYWNESPDVVISVANIDVSTAFLGAPSWTTIDTVDIAIDRVLNLIWFRVSGGSWNSFRAGDPTTGEGGIDIAEMGNGPLYPAATGVTSGTFTANFDGPFTYPPPPGFTAIGSAASARSVESGITIIDGAAGRFDVALLPADTEGLKGCFYYESEVINLGIVSTVLVGTVDVKPTLIKAPA